jgi:hypothetical protein
MNPFTDLKTPCAISHLGCAIKHFGDENKLQHLVRKRGTKFRGNLHSDQKFVSLCGIPRFAEIMNEAWNAETPMVER